MIAFVTGVLTGFTIVFSMMVLVDSTERGKCAKANNVYTCEYKGEWVPAAPGLK